MKAKDMTNLIMNYTTRTVEHFIKKGKLQNEVIQFECIYHAIKYYDEYIKDNHIDIETYNTVSNMFKDRLGFSYDTHIKDKSDYYLIKLFIGLNHLFFRTGYPYSYIKYKKEISLMVDMKKILLILIRNLEKKRFDIVYSCLIRIIEIDGNISITNFYNITDIVFEWENRN